MAIADQFMESDLLRQVNLSTSAIKESFVQIALGLVCLTMQGHGGSGLTVKNFNKNYEKKCKAKHGSK
jgi:hypothetical protein